MVHHCGRKFTRVRLVFRLRESYHEPVKRHQLQAVELQNEIEAGFLSSVLSDEGIPHTVRSYHDSAYDGIYQSQLGWGHVEAPIEYHTQIREILDDLRSSRDT
jgi:hypothetical protein